MPSCHGLTGQLLRLDPQLQRLTGQLLRPDAQLPWLTRQLLQLDAQLDPLRPKLTANSPCSPQLRGDALGRPRGHRHDGELRVYPERPGDGAAVDDEEPRYVVRLVVQADDAGLRILAHLTRPERVVAEPHEV